MRLAVRQVAPHPRALGGGDEATARRQSRTRRMRAYIAALMVCPPYQWWIIPTTRTMKMRTRIAFVTS
jgi:hypothetical protein